MALATSRVQEFTKRLDEMRASHRRLDIVTEAIRKQAAIQPGLAKQLQDITNPLESIRVALDGLPHSPSSIALARYIEQTGARLETVAEELNNRFQELSQEQHWLLPEDQPEIILHAGIVRVDDTTQEGALIQACLFPWIEIVLRIKKDPDFLFEFVKHPRKFEEFLAATYEQAGCPEVTLTPQSGDRGRDVIATWPGIGGICIYDQAKAYSARRVVAADDVRAMVGVSIVNQNVSKVVVTTTSRFAPGVWDEFKQLMPYRLELRDGPLLRSWLLEILHQ